ncbi:AMP-dependent synthetase/ligase [Schaalia sp. ZJ1691]|uniref:AMP-dependent synthetase/ligase n=1 Tax=Schaalia sp. ZJ1691 TaxID=2709404 RepID=UPI0013EB56CA|nr:AMP-dependent synthetase/ligase [Schaalia sp. ZJ1691]
MKKLRDGSFTEKMKFRVEHDDVIPSLLEKRARKNPGQVAVEKRNNVGQMVPVTAKEVLTDVENLARGLIGLGIDAGDAVAILAPTSYEWMVLDLAILSVGAITVPIYESDSAAQIRHILTDANVVLAFASNSQQAELISSQRTPQLADVLVFHSSATRALAEAAHRVTSRDLAKRRRAVDADDIATIIYTSGTTGKPKGVTLTHRNIVATALSAKQVLGEVIDSSHTRILLFLPVAHVLARLVMHLALACRSVIGFSPNISNLLPDIQEFQPSALLVVPRVLEKVYNSAAAKAGGGIKGKIFSWSAKQSRRSATRSGLAPLRTMRHRLADTLVLKKIRQVLGPNLTYIVSGGAPLATDLAEFFTGMGLTVLQGYGLSETTGPVTVQRLGSHPFGSVGQVIPGNYVKIAEDGEVLTRGVSLMEGYYNLPEQTREAIPDGWFHTGDLGTLDRHGHLKITGRKKELIVTAGGKNVSPEVLQESLATHPLIGSVIVVGDARPYIGALITLDTDMLPGWLKRHNLPVVPATEAGQLPEVRASLDRAIARANKQVSRAESIRRFRIIDATFTVDNGYMTPSLKLRRSQVLTDYAHEVEALYREGEKERRSKKR